MAAMLENCEVPTVTRDKRVAMVMATGEAISGDWSITERYGEMAADAFL